MPHGAGHIGGGHHGGGGFGGGGGFHHHHHHHGGFHHHHHHNRGWWGGPYAPYYGYSYRRRGVVWLIVVIFIIIVAVSLSISFSLRYGTDSSDIDTTKEYALTDKVIRSYNHDFCQGLQAKSTDAPNNFQSDATLYLLNSRPPLTDRESFNISERANLDSYDNNYHGWNFYMNAGSKVSFKACYPLDMNGNNLVKFYLIKGSRNHNKWTKDPDKSYSVKNARLTSQCQTISYPVQKDDMYYLVFYLDSYLSLSTVLDIDFHFDRTVYHISLDNVVRNCSFPLDGHSSCSIGVPMSSGYTAILSLTASLPIDYDDGANIRINCQPRVWLYAVIVVSAVVPVIIIIVLIVVCVCIKARKRKNRYSLLGRNTTVVGTDAIQESGNIKSGGGSTPATNPPAFNPAYPPAGGYGTTSGVPPPAYKQ